MTEFYGLFDKCGTQMGIFTSEINAIEYCYWTLVYHNYRGYVGGLPRLFFWERDGVFLRAYSELEYAKAPEFYRDYTYQVRPVSPDPDADDLGGGTMKAWAREIGLPTFEETMKGIP